jgi:serine/threonine-protein kinase RIO1
MQLKKVPASGVQAPSRVVLKRSVMVAELIVKTPLTIAPKADPDVVARAATTTSLEAKILNMLNPLTPFDSLVLLAVRKVWRLT